MEVFGVAVVQDAGGGEMRFTQGWGCAIRRQALDCLNASSFGDWDYSSAD